MNDRWTRGLRAWGSEWKLNANLLRSVSFFVISIVISYFTIGYTNSHASSSVADIVLSNVPVVAVGAWFVYGTLVLIAFVGLVAISHPKRFPFVLSTLGLFWLIRSIFTSLTHIGSFPDQTSLELGTNFGKYVAQFFVGNDYFFSGHVGTPFILALVFWNKPLLRYAFLSWSVYFLFVVLLGHLHYSIDVASAFFISFSIYHLALYLFPSEYRQFTS